MICWKQRCLQAGLVLLVLLSACNRRVGTGSRHTDTYTKPAVPASKMARKVIDVARSYEGTPYKYGGASRSGLDCSGLVMICYETVGVKLPRSSYDQATVGKEISRNEVRPGDLVFFVTGKKSGRISHVGIVTERRGNNEIKFIHSSNTGVREDNLYSDYYQKTFAKAIRLL